MAEHRFPQWITSHGEYQSDISRDTFAPLLAFRRVLAQQGRPVIDADLNEQTAILLDYIEKLAVTLGGPHFGGHGAFAVSLPNPVPNELAMTDLRFAPGAYFVQGMLCELLRDKLPEVKAHDPQNPKWEGDFFQEVAYLVVLDAWERHVTHLRQPSIREVALGGGDTCARSQVTFRILCVPLPNGPTVDGDTSRYANYEEFLKLLPSLGLAAGAARLSARTADPTGAADDPCTASPGARFRGRENQLYRVEVVGYEKAEDGPVTSVSYKWSRENASVLMPVKPGGVSGQRVQLAEWPRDGRLALQREDLVELVSEKTEPHNPGDLFRVMETRPEHREITLHAAPSDSENADPLWLRRWDHAGAADGLLDSAPLGEEVELEDGIWVTFTIPAASDGEPPALPQPGDYWLIPARTATGDVEWPRDDDNNPIAMPPQGVHHALAPLAEVYKDGSVWQAVGTRSEKP